MSETYPSLLDRAIEALEGALNDEYGSEHETLAEELEYIKEERDELEALETADYNAPFVLDIERSVNLINEQYRALYL